MRICVTAQKSDLDAQVDPRFGRCAWFIIVDSDSLEFEAIENREGQSSGGAGVRAGQLMSEKQVQVVATGSVGPNAFQVLNAAGISIADGVSGTVREAVQRVASGGASFSEKPSAESHAGLKGAP
ncbi:NifB/NifX family molybdenum-iron cluster-binding protein [bacterium]|nr:NifB/NifX family molybdenum-iron cluster-binding protein [bacterium]